MANLLDKQQLKLKSPIKDINKRLEVINDEFDLFYPIVRISRTIPDPSLGL